MTELRENCTWRRCSVSRARFRLKLYEPAVKCLGDVGPAEILLDASTFSLDSNIFISTRKAFYPGRSRLFVTHLGSFICIYITPRHLACFSLFLSKILTVLLCRDKSRSTSEVKSGNLQRLTSRRSYRLLPEGAIFLLYVFYIRQVYTWGVTYMRPL